MNQVMNFDRPEPGPRFIDAAREANHRIANNLSLLVAALHLQTRAIARTKANYSTGEVTAILDDVAARMHAITTLHRTLARDSGTGDVDLGEHLSAICASLSEAFGAHDRAEIVCDLDNIKLSPSCASSVALIVTEVVTNALKYAHPTGIPTRIAVTCRRGERAIEIEVADDGIGLPEGTDPLTATSIGFELVRALARSIGGTLVYADEGLGLSVQLSIPA